MATTDDIEEIMMYFKDEWKEDHILALNKSFFCYEFQHGDRINFMLAINKETNQIDCTQGFIQNSKELYGCDVWGVMTKVRSSVKMPFLGVETIKRLERILEHHSYSGVGVNPRTLLPLSKKIFKRKTGKLDHYYRLANLESYEISIIRNKNIIDLSKEIIQFNIQQFNSSEELFERFKPKRQNENAIFKDRWYIKKRYFEHPIYQYRVFGITNSQDEIKSILITRVQMVQNKKILRIVDFIGIQEDFGHIGWKLEELIERENYEYVDLYAYGMDDAIIYDAGLIKKDEDDGNIIPNYFEPFVQSNIDIWFETTIEKPLIFKGDGDQDRPSIT